MPGEVEWAVLQEHQLASILYKKAVPLFLKLTSQVAKSILGVCWSQQRAFLGISLQEVHRGYARAVSELLQPHRKT